MAELADAARGDALFMKAAEVYRDDPAFDAQALVEELVAGEAVPLNNRNLLAYSLRFPFITLKVITLIHWHALKLYLKKIPFHKKKEDPHLQTGILPKKSQLPDSPAS